MEAYCANTRNQFGWQKWLMLLCACAASALPGCSFAQSPQAEQVVLDRVVAVVNNETILASDLENEIHLSVLEPGARAGTQETQLDALQRLISRALIEQQMNEEGAPVNSVNAAEMTDREQMLRRDLPECVRFKCETASGWNDFLRSHDLTQDEVNDYLRNRLAILHFIELRFRQGIRISHEEVETYYRDLLVPQYGLGETPPPVEQVAPRIQEILLQQRVNALFSDWLENLRKQGQIEILDPKLGSALAASVQGVGAK